MNCEKKYSEEAVKILTELAEIKTNQKNDGEKIEDIHRSLKVQWEKIDNANVRLSIVEAERIVEKEERIRDKVWWRRASVYVITAVIGLIGGLFGVKLNVGG